MSRRQAKVPLYEDGVPTENFNRRVKDWLAGDIQVREHKTPAAFEPLRIAYSELSAALKEDGMPKEEAYRFLMSNLTDVMLGVDLGPALATLESATLNPRGFRSALSQGMAKNTGENFINVITYALASYFEDSDDILVDKGTPVPVKPYLTLSRFFEGTSGKRVITMPIECDLAIWPRGEPARAIVVSAKTRLKEVFHIGTMWKLLYDMIGDEYSLDKWGLEVSHPGADMLMVFATADMVPTGANKTQGGDVERDQPRNLIAMDASFFDYVFVSKLGIDHVSSSLDLKVGREALFHELGCLLDLVEQRFG